ncbi:hypothetical protein ASPWEDRAFT_35658 [Aspergillus wentii DTO 134E9]|uniref:Peptidase metallopeptidase domain-containing protein n=1 Tax=Aspergillus wentii DTO 134E9 TaxID=1073089 RepID=A0A1L9RT05_ASPWE|nr:uncharacterized protein ASPWEDRAFT_35658 [Aspergillus wentii DTO 134E9]OJJ38096.1 hypothetical protein ASPWEDRAFT_35658 [Aspergillus wentii DTO 134E9]
MACWTITMFPHASFLLLCCLFTSTVSACFDYHVPHNHTHQPSRRWNVIYGDPYSQKWPDGKIKYCFKDKISRDKLKKPVEQAWNLWVTAGVRRDIQMVWDKKYCTEDDADDYLEISYNDQYILSTSPGKWNYLLSHPTMALDPRDDFGSGSGISNIAHEIGHAWGFFHEHSRKDLWSRDYGGTAEHNTFTWNCQNLKDYPDKAKEHPNLIDKMCHYNTFARTYKFSAFNFLPEPDSRHAEGAFDEDSIMMYGSTAGAVAGKTVYTKTDGSLLHYNRAPSPLDVAKLNSMYDPPDSTGQRSGLFWSKSNPNSNLFRRIVGKKDCK